MAKITESQVGVWHKVTSTVEAAEDTGNILTPLYGVYVQYLLRAARHNEAGKPARAAYYNEQAGNVARLING